MGRIKTILQKIICFCAFLITLLSSMVCAAETYINLSLNDALQIALKNNEERKVSLQAAAIAESQYQEALSARWPTIGLQANFMRMDEDPTFVYPQINIPITSISAPLNAALGGLAPGLKIPSSINVPEQKLKLIDRDTATASLQMMIPLYTGGKISSVISQANLGKQIAQEEYHRTTLQVVRDVKRYYYAIQLTQALTALAHDTAESLASTKEITKALYEGGSGTVNKLDYLKTEMAHNYARSLEIEFSSREKSAKAALIHVMGVPWNSTVEIPDHHFPKPNNQPALASLVEQAHQFNPQMGIIKLAVQVAEAKITEAQSAYYPQVALTGNITHIANSYDAGLVNNDNLNSWTIGLVMKMPVFDFGRTSNNVNTAKLQREQVAEKQILLEQGIAAQIKSLFIALDTANQQIEVSESTLAYSRDFEHLTGQAYQIGAAKPEDMVQASIYNAIVEGNLLRTQHDVAYSLAEIEYFLGAEIK